MTHTTHLPERHRNDQWKQPCRVATTAPVTISTAFNAGDTIDGVTLVAGDRILAKDQSTGSQNGIYVAGPSPARAYDMDTSDEVQGAIVYVKAGTANGGKAYKNTNTSAVTLGTTALTFTEFGAGGGGGVTVQDEGTPLATTKTTLNFVGSGVTATGAGATATITISGSSIAQIDGTGDGHISFNATSVDMYSPNGWLGGSEWSEFYLKEGRITLTPVHTPASFSTKGIVMQVGTDGHFLYVSEASSSLLEVHGDSSASYDIAFTDDPSASGASPGRFLFADESGNTSIPSLGVPRKFSSDPTPQVAGECYYNTSTNKVKVWDGSTWNNLW